MRGTLIFRWRRLFPELRGGGEKDRAEATPESGNDIKSFPSGQRPGMRAGGGSSKEPGLWEVGRLLTEPKPLRAGHTL